MIQKPIQVNCKKMLDLIQVLYLENLKIVLSRIFHLIVMTSSKITPIKLLMETRKFVRFAVIVKIGVISIVDYVTCAYKDIIIIVCSLVNALGLEILNIST